jgi:hypothetical protein
MDEHTPPQPEAGPPDSRVDRFDPPQRADYISRVVQHRCGDVLSEAEIKDRTGEDGGESAHVRAAGEAEMVPMEIVSRILEVVTAIDERIGQIEDHLLRSGAEGRA